MTSGWILLALLLIAACGFAIAAVLPHLVGRAPTGGDENQGLVIFVEPIRWLGLFWGLRPFCRGLRRYGFAGEIRHWQWCSDWRGWLVLPALMDQRNLQFHAQKLADFIENQRKQFPTRPLMLAGYSCGGFVAARALELLPAGVKVESAALIAASVSPRRDYTAAASHLKGNFVLSSSLADWLILGLGTMLFGTSDRHYTPSVGMVGLARRTVVPANRKQIKWLPGMIVTGHLGGHFTATAAGFTARYIAPAMGLCPRS